MVWSVTWFTGSPGVTHHWCVVLLMSCFYMLPITWGIRNRSSGGMVETRWQGPRGGLQSHPPQTQYFSPAGGIRCPTWLSLTLLLYKSSVSQSPRLEILELSSSHCRLLPLMVSGLSDPSSLAATSVFSLSFPAPLSCRSNCLVAAFSSPTLFLSEILPVFPLYPLSLRPLSPVMLQAP